MDSEDWYLESAIAAAIDSATTDGLESGADIARRVLTAISDRAPYPWIVAEVGLYDGRPSSIRAVTSLGEDEASVIGCAHLWKYSNGTVASDKKGDRDVDYLHICCLDDHIAEMISLRELKRRANEGHTDLPPCAHASAAYTGSGDEPRPCQACGTLVTSKTSPTPPKVVNTPDLFGSGSA